ncbi:MAG TPA: hypothetical protein VMH24_03410, partial [Candidatus Sulfotelmatobacter sp.]|nr:hypothetical protein [Candidatus Sulfotelmatobacter sp.]
TNRAGGERSLITFHNRWAAADGVIARSAPFGASEAGGPGTENLAQALALAADRDAWYAARDLVTGREHLIHGPTVAREGRAVRLGAFDCQVLLDWRELAPDRPWAEVAARIGADGAADVEAVLAGSPPADGPAPAERPDGAAGPEAARVRGIIEGS